MIYLASPYSHPDPEVKVQRYDEACLATAALMREGKVVFCPIAHCHSIATHSDLPTDWNFWSTYDLEILSHCDQLYVLMLDGWLTSTGVNAEIDFAMAHGIPVTYVEAGSFVPVQLAL